MEYYGVNVLDDVFRVWQFVNSVNANEIEHCAEYVMT
jgi:hypothetical protein